RLSVEGVVTNGARGSGARLGRAPPQPEDRGGRPIRGARCAVGTGDREDGWPRALLRLRDDVFPSTLTSSGRGVVTAGRVGPGVPRSGMRPPITDGGSLDPLLTHGLMSGYPDRDPST